jgi:hypothetical protein
MLTRTLDQSKTWFLGLHPNMGLELKDILIILNLERLEDLNRLKNDTKIFMERVTDG